jgi:hypothetical protein
MRRDDIESGPVCSIGVDKARLYTTVERAPRAVDAHLRIPQIPRLGPEALSRRR